MFYYGFDLYYLYLIVPAMLISLFAQIRVKSSFSKYSNVFCSMNGAQAAEAVLNLNGVHGVKIERVQGSLTDHFDPRTNIIRLSDTVFSSNTVAAVGVAAHEAGHAVQYAKQYAPIKIRAAILPLCNIGSRLSIPLILIGMIASFSFLIDLGIIFFALAITFQLVTLPVEFNASRRALAAIREHNLLTKEEDYKGAKKVLSAAALTYVAAFLLSLMQLVRLIAISGRRRN